MMDGLTEDPIVRIHCTKLCTIRYENRFFNQCTDQIGVTA